MARHTMSTSSLSLSTFLLCVVLSLMVLKVTAFTDVYDAFGSPNPSCPVPCSDHSCCPAESECCTDVCCGGLGLNPESCCQDEKNGGICCLDMESHCCPLQGVRPSHCCPHWHVCCEIGEYGCCDPAVPLPPLGPTDVSVSASDIGKMSTFPGFVQGLFIIPTWTGNSVMTGVQVTADYEHKNTPIPKYVTNDGELTRLFMHNPTKNVFYTMTANYTAPMTKTPQLPIIFKTLDPVTATTTIQVLSGAFNQVTGCAFHDQTQSVIFSTYAYSGATQIGYSFYSLDVATLKVTLMSTYKFVNGVDDYAGWFRNISPDAKTTYRLGYKDVIKSLSFGLGVTNIASPVGKYNFQLNVTLPTDVSYYFTMSVVDENTFLSMGPSLSTGEFVVVKWQLDGTATKLGTLSFLDTADTFGPVGQVVSADGKWMAAFLNHKEADSDFDRVAMVVVDIEAGSVTSGEISPWMLSLSDSVSGIGIPKQ